MSIGKTCGYDLCGTCYSEPPAGTINTPFDKIILVTDGFSNLSGTSSTCSVV